MLHLRKVQQVSYHVAPTTSQYCCHHHQDEADGRAAGERRGGRLGGGERRAPFTRRDGRVQVRRGEGARSRHGEMVHRTVSTPPTLKPCTVRNIEPVGGEKLVSMFRFQTTPIAPSRLGHTPRRARPRPGVGFGARRGGSAGAARRPAPVMAGWTG